MIPTLALLIFPVLMALAAFSDLFTMRISNRLVLATFAGFLVVAFAAGMPLPVLGMHLAGAALVLAVAFALFVPGWIGGGDAKLAATTALWIGPDQLLPHLVYAGLLGGALTLAILVARRLPLPANLTSIGWVARLHDARSGVPYGIALAVAGIIVYRHTTIFQYLAS